MEKSKVYFTDFRVPVGTSWLAKLKKLCVAAGFKNIDMERKVKEFNLLEMTPDISPNMIKGT